MSQASKSKDRARKRWHWQVARFIASLGDVSPHLRGGAPEFHVRRGRAHGLLAGRTFDVHAVREAALKFVALEDEQAVFEDWTRARGLGPENREPGAFGSLGWECIGCGARQSSGDGCESCGASHVALLWCGQRSDWPGKLAREWAERGGDRRAPMGRSLARLGRRVLAAIEGQPSECQGAFCKRGNVRITRPELHRLIDAQAEPAVLWEWDYSQDPPVASGSCPDCQGTGHNLRGVLPPIEWGPQVQRRIIDSHRAACAAERVADCWLSRMPPSAWRMPQPARTRVCPRGEHRNLWSRDIGETNCHRKHLPRWRRGELRHAAQRRVKRLLPLRPPLPLDIVEVAP